MLETTTDYLMYNLVLDYARGYRNIWVKKRVILKNHPFIIINLDILFLSFLFRLFLLFKIFHKIIHNGSAYTHI